VPASSIAVDVRGVLKTELASITANVYDTVPESPIVPFAAVLPMNPYLEIEVFTKNTVRTKVNLLIVVGVASYSNAASLDNIERLIISILAALPAGYEIGNISNPTPQLLASGSEVLAAEIEVTTRYTQTN
jgi:hypothetical protein